MKERLSYIRCFLIVSIFLLYANTLGQQKVMWKGSRYAENGVIIVKNPGEPLYGELKLELLEELSIGRKNAEEYSFSLISDVKADSAGNIYVADTKNLRILKFNRNGIHMKTFGKRGIEFQQPSKIRIENLSGRIFVKAYALDIEVFDHRDQHKNSIHVKSGPIIDFAPIDETHVVAVVGTEYRDDNPRIVHSLFLLDSNGGMRRLSDEYFRYALKSVRLGGIGIAWTANESGFEPELHLSKLDDSLFIYGYSKEYELNVIEKEGKVVLRIMKNSPRPIFTPEERRIFRINSTQDFKPHFFHLLTDSMARIYVQRNITKGLLNAVQENVDRDVDIFSKDGYFLYTSRLPANTCEIKDGYLFAYAVDEANGLESVKRYKIKNWEGIETGCKIRP